MTDCFKVISKSDDEAEILIYGELAETAQTDWWSGEELEGYVTQTAFVEEVKALKDKKYITVRINSCGGSTFVGMAMYSQLKALPAKKTVIIDGIAASAATLVMLAGDCIKIPIGSMVMIHEAAGCVAGFYTVAELEERIKALTKINLSAAESYSSRTGKPVKEILALMAEETWFTGKEAVAAGFADELLYDVDPDIVMSVDRQFLVVNGKRLNTGQFKNLPEIKEMDMSVNKNKADEDGDSKKPEADDDGKKEQKTAEPKKKDDGEDDDEVNSRISSIIELCELAGADIATVRSFISSGQSVSSVRKALLKQNAGSASIVSVQRGVKTSSLADIARSKYGK